MPYIDPKVVLEAKKMNLLTILKNFEPHELVRLDKNNYTTRTHDSLKISNGKWMWFSRGIGGTTALNYLIEVKGYSFIEVVETITGKQVVVAPKPIKQDNKYYDRNKVILGAMNMGIPIGSFNYNTIIKNAYFKNSNLLL